jgi:ribosomal protein S18 acetylase RimI-like enzyme
MSARFRRAALGDVDTLLAMMRELYQHESIAFSEPRAKAALERLVIDDTCGRAWLIEDANAPEAIGYAVMTLGYSLEFGGRDAFVDEIYVREEHRSQGIGQRAIAILEDACRELGVVALHLEVERSNARAQVVYRTAGFEDHDRYLMTKWLDGKT